MRSSCTRVELIFSTFTVRFTGALCSSFASKPASGARAVTRTVVAFFTGVSTVTFCTLVMLTFLWTTTSLVLLTVTLVIALFCATSVTGGRATSPL